MGSSGDSCPNAREQIVFASLRESQVMLTGRLAAIQSRSIDLSVDLNRGSQGPDPKKRSVLAPLAVGKGRIFSGKSDCIAQYTPDVDLTNRT